MILNVTFFCWFWLIVITLFNQDSVAIKLFLQQSWYTALTCFLYNAFWICDQQRSFLSCFYQPPETNWWVCKMTIKLCIFLAGIKLFYRYRIWRPFEAILVNWWCLISYLNSRLLLLFFNHWVLLYSCIVWQPVIFNRL